ncbi:MAG TPA: hypothetical protein VLD62_05985 [Acidimicrobiia bacterium]|nr:hypothetical protein [Acidimicrobiia bacterium]
MRVLVLQHHDEMDQPPTDRRHGHPSLGVLEPAMEPQSCPS